ncbi:MAG: TatD family hydrolase, partial [Clostridia bacterium]
MFFDTHAHLDDERFDDDRDACIRSLAAVGVSRVLNASSDMASSHRTAALCEKYPFIYGAVGVHPHEAEKMTDADFDTLTALSHKPK